MEKIILMAHNGVTGANPVEPFKGAEFIDQPEGAREMEYAGRNFTRAFTRDGAAHFREVRFGEPSDWAKARANG